MAKTEVENTTDGGIEVDQQAEGKNEQQTEASGITDCNHLIYCLF